MIGRCIVSGVLVAYMFLHSPATGQENFEMFPWLPSEENFLYKSPTIDIPKDPDQYVLWHSTQPTNISKYKNPRIDKLLEDGRVELNQETRKKIYLDFQRFLVEDSPAIFLYHPSFFTVLKK